MRIALDARCVADHFPGIGRYVYNLARALAALGAGHRLLLIHSPALPNTRHDMAALAALPGVELVPTDARLFRLGEQRAIPALLRRLRPDIYHAPYYIRPYAPLPCPSVTTLYDAIPHIFPHEVSPRARLLFGALTRLAARASRHLITISASARHDLCAAYGIDPSRITVTPLAADARFCPDPPQAEAALARHGLRPGYVLAVGSNKPHKNLPLLVEAYAALGDDAPPLVLAGHWDARYPQAREAAERLGLAQRVRFLSGVAEADLPALYAGAAVFAFPSRYEGFGLPPLEAMACGTPVVCGDVSSLPEVVGDAARLVRPLAAQPLAHALRHLLASPEQRAQLRQRGLAQAASFTWESTARRTLALYEQLA